MPGVSKGGSLDLSVRVAMKENNAWIWPVIVGVNRSHRVQLVHDGGIDLRVSMR